MRHAGTAATEPPATQRKQSTSPQRPVAGRRQDQPPEQSRQSAGTGRQQRHRQCRAKPWPAQGVGDEPTPDPGPRGPDPAGRHQIRPPERGHAAATATTPAAPTDMRRQPPRQGGRPGRRRIWAGEGLGHTPHGRRPPLSPEGVSVDARRPFDGMPPKRNRAKDKGAARQEACGDRLSALPDDVLHHLLSLLPAQQAVRTCVLARRWRHLWRSATGLRITGLRISRGGKNKPASLMEIREFVNHLVLLRGGSPLVNCEINLVEFDDDDAPCIDQLIQHVLMCKVQVLNINIRRSSGGWTPCHQIDERLLVSQHLKRLHLSNQRLEFGFLDLSSCPALEILEFSQCGYISVDIMSPSIKSLSFYDVCEFSDRSRSHIYAPNLVSLLLEVSYGIAPVLERMPSLVEAVVTIDPNNSDWCTYTNSGDCGNGDCSSCSVEGDLNGCVLFQGLSEAQSLVLISTDMELFIFRRDLKCCPIFSNLKTLLLNEYWCLPADLSVLACILEHSPVLEKLTLQLYCNNSKSKLQMKGSPDPTERTTSISDHLKIVEVKCDNVDDRVQNVLKFLSNKLHIHSYKFQFDE